jgi:molybdate transport system substrate-binding protein
MEVRGNRLGLVVLLAAVVLLGISGCTTAAQPVTDTATPAAEPTELRVSAALTLKKSFEEMAPAFEKANSAKLVYNFGTAGVLQKQIEGGAPVDVFASASPKQIEPLVKAGLASAEDTAAFAQNQLVIVVPVGNPAGIKTPADLAKAKRIVTGDPLTTPHGAQAEAWLTQMGLFASVKPALIYADTLDTVARGEVDAGIVFVSSAKTNSKVEIVYTVPPSEMKPATYVADTIVASKEQELGKKFIEYLLSPEGQDTLTKNGFLPAP